MSPFSERDEMDAYLYRFERCAELQRWPRDAWATYLAGLLTGKALDVYARLTPDQSRNYETLKSALLKRYAMTSDGYRKKFYECRPEPGESPPQFIVRLENYFMRWVDLEKIEQSFDGLRTLLIREGFLATCPKSLEVFLKERAIKDLDKLGKLAEQQKMHIERHSLPARVISQTHPTSHPADTTSLSTKPVRTRLNVSFVGNPVT